MRPIFGKRLTACLSAAIAATLILSPQVAFAKSKKKDAAPEACPVDTAIRTADPALLRRFGLLESCAAQVAVMPATPEEYVDPNVVMVNVEDTEQGRRVPFDRPSGNSFGPPRLTDGLQAGIGIPAQGAGVELVDYRGVGYADRPSSYYREDASFGSGPNFSQVALSGHGVAIAIRPRSNEVAVDARLLSRSAMPRFSNFQAGGEPAASVEAGMNILSMEPRSYNTIHDDLIARTAQKHRIDPLLLHAVIKQESGYKAGAVSHAGARGLMQIMPATGRSLGVATGNLHNAELNVDAGARLLRKLWFKYDGNIDLMLAAYNAGEGAVAKFGNRIPPYRETRNYVTVIKAHYYKLLAEQGAGQPAK